MKSSRPRAALLALAAVAGCGQSRSQVIITVSGDAAGAVTLFARVVDEGGARKEVHAAGDAEHPVMLPATVYLQLSQAHLAGVVVWVADAGGTILAQAASEHCFQVAGGQRLELKLARAPMGWSPAVAERCRCDAAAPAAPMCPAGTPDGGVLDGGGDAIALDAGADGAAAADVAADAPPTDAADDARDARASDAAPDAVPARDAAADVAPARDARSPALSPVMVPNALFGFEATTPDWISADTPLAHDTAQRTEGQASLALTVGGGGRATLHSRDFATAALAPMSARISVDLFVNERQVGDANLEMWVDCQSARVFGVYLGYKALAALKAGAWTPLVFDMPDPVAAAFDGDYRDCQISFKIDGKGLFRFDRMGFAP